MLHKNHNYVIENSLFADNTIGVDVDRTDGAIVRDTVIIGESQSYRDLMARQVGVKAVCFHGSLIGIDMHTWTLLNEYGGARLENISVSGFDESVACRNAISIHVDDHNLEEDQFEFYASFSNIQLADGAESISFCKAEDGDIETVHFIDLDGSLSPDSVSPTGASMLLGSSPEIRRFVDPDKCTEMDGLCYSYCRDTCFRSVRYETLGTQMDNYDLKACKMDDPSDCSTFQGGRRGPNDPHSFIAHLPVGSRYNLFFVNGSGNEVDPASDGIIRYEPNFCPAGSGLFEVTFDGQSIPTLEPVATASPTSNPTDSPTSSPTDLPTSNPTEEASASPTESPTSSPIDSTASPSQNPTESPTASPTKSPAGVFTQEGDQIGVSTEDDPTDAPAAFQTDAPTNSPTNDEPMESREEPADPPSATSGNGSYSPRWFLFLQCCWVFLLL